MNSDAASPPGGESLSDDAFYGGRLRLWQPAKGGHRSGTDAALLQAIVAAAPGETVADLGAGVGAAGLGVALRVPACRVTLLEIDAGLVALAARNIARNGLAGRAEARVADIAARERARRWGGLKAASQDHVMINPPFYAPGRHRASPAAGRALAHVAADGLDPWIRAAAGLLKPGGRLALVHRADALAEILAALGGRFGDIVLRPVHPRPGAAAIRLLVSARMGRRGPPAIAPGLVLHGADGSAFTEEARRLMEGGALE